MCGYVNDQTALLLLQENVTEFVICNHKTLKVKFLHNIYPAIDIGDNIYRVYTLHNIYPAIDIGEAFTWFRIILRYNASSYIVWIVTVPIFLYHVTIIISNI